MKNSMCLALVMTLLAVSPSAASVTFDFTGNAGFINLANQPLSVSAGSLAVEVRGYIHSGGGSGNAPFNAIDQRFLHQSPNGLGVRSSFNDNTNQLDAVGRNELMRFNFSGPVKLLSMVLSLASGNDEFDMAIDNVDVNVNALLGTDRIADTSNSHITANGGGFAFPILDYTIDFSDVNLASFSQLDLYTDDNGDGYKIVSITVSSVPEATSVLIWGTLLGVLGMTGHRRKK